MIKTVSKQGTKGKSLTPIKGINQKKPTINIILHGERLNALLLRSRTRLSPLLFNIVLEVVINAVKTKKEIKGV